MYSVSSVEKLFQFETSTIFDQVIHLDFLHTRKYLILFFMRSFFSVFQSSKGITSSFFLPLFSFVLSFIVASFRIEVKASILYTQLNKTALKRKLFVVDMVSLCLESVRFVSRSIVVRFTTCEVNCFRNWYFVFSRPVKY